LKAVADTSVLIALKGLGYLGYLPKVFEEVLLSGAVMEEARGEELHEDLERLVSQGFVRVAETTNLELVELLSAGLGAGEAETIALASDVNADLALLDDLKSRKAARRLGIRVMGTLGTLRLLMDAGHIHDRPEELCRALISQGFWVDAELCLKVLGGGESNRLPVA
jgi:predicted nucleic acid-binding protein